MIQDRKTPERQKRFVINQVENSGAERDQEKCSSL